LTRLASAGYARDLAMSKLVLDPVLHEEAEFANRDYAKHADELEINPVMSRRYFTPDDVSDWRQMSALLLGDLRGKDLLDMACGMGEESVYFAKLGANVTGIDISRVGVESLRSRAAFHGLSITALEMRADPTEFPDASVDRVHGLGILHHVGIATGLAEVHRLLRPGGLAVFLEPLGDTAGIEAAKTWLMRHARFLGEFEDVTDHERNLTWREVETEVGRFSRASVFPYHLLYRLKRLLPYGRSNPHGKLGLVRRIDHAVLTLIPALRRFAGGVVIRVHKD